MNIHATTPNNCIANEKNIQMFFFFKLIIFINFHQKNTSMEAVEKKYDKILHIASITKRFICSLA